MIKCREHDILNSSISESSIQMSKLYLEKGEKEGYFKKGGI